MTNNLGWVETNPSNICIFSTDIRIWQNKLLAEYLEAIKIDVRIQMFMDVRWVVFHPQNNLTSGPLKGWD